MGKGSCPAFKNQRATFANGSHINMQKHSHVQAICVVPQFCRVSAQRLPCNFPSALVEAGMHLIHRLFAILLFVLAGLTPVSARAAGEVLPVALAGNIAGDSASTRFFIDFDSELPVKTFYMDQPNRIVIDIGEADFEFANGKALEPRGLITDVQFGRIAKGRSRIVLTLLQPAEIIKASMSKRLDHDTYRFLLDIDSTDEDTYSALLEEQRKTIGESGLKAHKGDRVKPVEKKEPGRFTIVLDPGHGGIDGGATGRGGTQEKDIVLDFAFKLRELLENAGPFDVLLTREEDVFMSLRERLSFNRRSNSDLFISIHADSLRQRYVRGSTIYTLSKKASDKLSERLAESENSVDLVAGLAVEEEVAIVTDILVDLTTRETTRFSRRFSDILVDRLSDKIRLIKNPQRSAAFGVLKAPEVPGVLIELGYLSNAEDEKLLQDDAWHAKTAKAITEAAIEFFSYRINQ